MTIPRPRVEGVRRSPESLADLSLSRGALDRAADRRKDPDALSVLLGQDATRVLELVGGAAETVALDGRTALQLRSPREQDADRLGVLLGVEGDGTAYVGVVGEAADEGEPRDWRTLREVGAILDDRDAGLFTTMLALANWHAAHTHCPRCGADTEPVQAGWVRRCMRDGSEHYPRTDPAVIMSVTDPQDRLLLARGPHWPERRFSVLAGFVEPGESLEAAVAREVREEVGVVVDQIRYLGNQPWPFPSSLMVGFTARTQEPTVRVDRDEIAEAFWVDRDELAAGVAAGSIAISPRLSIARRLIEQWYGAPLAQAVEWFSPTRRD